MAWVLQWACLGSLREAPSLLSTSSAFFRVTVGLKEISFRLYVSICKNIQFHRLISERNLCCQEGRSLRFTFWLSTETTSVGKKKKRKKKDKSFRVFFPQLKYPSSKWMSCWVSLLWEYHFYNASEVREVFLSLNPVLQKHASLPLNLNFVCFNWKKKAPL